MQAPSTIVDFSVGVSFSCRRAVSHPCTHRRATRRERAAVQRKLHVSHAVAATNEPGDMRIPVTVLTGFLGCVSHVAL